MTLLPPYQRLITGHDSEGKAIVLDTFGSNGEFTSLPDTEASFSLGYLTSQFPIDFHEDKDLKVYEAALKNPPGLVNYSGTVLRVVDIGPGLTSPMHRTVSCDYAVVIVGEIELVLDSGETRLMKPGDVCIQRGTMHAWRNVSKTNWGRMLYVLQPAVPIKHNGAILEEDYGTMAGVKPSS